MALNPLIPLQAAGPQVQPIDILGPQRYAGAVLNLRDMMLANQAQQMKLEEARKSIAEEDALRSLYTQPTPPTQAQIISTVGPSRALPIFKAQSEAEKSQAETGKFKAETTLKQAEALQKRLDAAGSIAGAVLANPTQEGHLKGVTDLMQAGELTPDQARMYAALDISDPKVQNLWKQFQNRAVSASDQLKAQQAAPLQAAQLEEATAKAFHEGLANFAPTVRGAKTQEDWDKALSQASPSVQKYFKGVPFSPQLAASVQSMTVPETSRIQEEQKAKELAIRQREADIKAAAADPFGLGNLAGGGAAPAGGAPGGMPTSGPGVTPLMQAIADQEGFGVSGSVAQRNNNPGNLRAGPGQTGTDANGYAIFPDVQTGWNAMRALIDKQSGQGLTLGEFIGGRPGVYPGYAPAGDRNNPAAYTAAVAGKLNVKPDTPLGQVAAGPQMLHGLTPDMTGQEMLDHLPKPLAEQVKGMAEGRINVPSGFALRSPWGQGMMALVAQYDPSFDTNNPAKRRATAIDFASGTSAQTINRLNTAIGHLNDLSTAADKLNNKGFRVWNTVKNYVASETGDPDIKRFDATKKAVVDELTRVWRGTGGSEGDIKSWSSTLDSSDSPASLHGVIAQIGSLLESKLAALKEQYHQGMGPTSAGVEMLTPQSRTVLTRLEGKARGENVPATIKMIAPNGQASDVPADQVSHYLSKGAKLAPAQ